MSVCSECVGVNHALKLTMAVMSIVLPSLPSPGKAQEQGYHNLTTRAKSDTSYFLRVKETREVQHNSCMLSVIISP
jgi:hypothetical protein